MIKFSPSIQTFYNMLFNYNVLPNDLVDVTEEQHIELLAKINEGCVVFSDLTFTTPKPSQFHTWRDSEWVDDRSPEEVAKSLPALSAKDFRHMLDRAGLRDDIELLITQIEDPQVKRAIQNEYEYAQFFERTHPAVLYMIKLLELDDERVNMEWKTPIDFDLVLPEVE